MKSISLRAATLALLAVTLIACTPGRAQDQTAPPAAAGLPPGIDPNSQTAEVLKLVQAGLDPSVITAYIANATGTFNLDADQIITLKDAGVPSATINLMMDHDRNLAANSAPSVTPAPVPSTPDNTPPPPDGSATPVAYSTPDTTADNGPDTTPPPPVTIDYFNQNLSGYGSWIVIPGYGRCWRPTTVLTDPNWRPYCDHGHWIYTDCGWYWASDYSWSSTFHYGRWLHHPGFGWCWYPDMEWAPSWVTWRSSDDYCGWAPLPPFAVYRPGAGFFYRGAVVSVNFDFGLGDNVFIFVDHDHFCDPHPRRFCLDADHGRDVFRRTTIINHFDVHEDRDRHDRVVVNAGIPVDKVRPRSGGEIKPVAVGSLSDARREGWRGTVLVPQRTGPNFPAHNAPKTGSQVQGNPKVIGNTGNFHTSDNNNNSQGVTHFNNSFNNPGTTRPNSQALNNNNSQNNQVYHVVSQSPSGVKSTAHYSSPTTTTVTPAVNNNSTQPNHTVNSTYNNNHVAQPGKTYTPGGGSYNPRPQAQFQLPQNNSQTRYNNNTTVPAEPRVQSTPQVTQSPQTHATAPAYTAPASNAHSSSHSTSGNSGTGNQSHNSGNNNNNQQQNH